MKDVSGDYWPVDFEFLVAMYNARPVQANRGVGENLLGLLKGDSDGEGGRGDAKVTLAYDGRKISNIFRADCDRLRSIKRAPDGIGVEH